MFSTNIVLILFYCFYLPLQLKVSFVYRVTSLPPHFQSMFGISFGYFFSSDNFFPEVNCFVLKEFYVAFQKFYFGNQFNILLFILGSILESIICALLKECLEKRMDNCYQVRPCH